MISPQKREVGDLSIELEKNTFKQGENVKGTLKINLLEKYVGESVYLLLLGKLFGKTYRHSKNEKTENWDDTNIREDSKNIVCQRYELFNFKNAAKTTDGNENEKDKIESMGDCTINSGQYQISFNFQLPEVLEYSSTACKGAYGISKDVSDHYDFYVKYFIEVFVPTKDTACQPLSDRYNLTIIGNDTLNYQKTDKKGNVENKGSTKELKIQSSGGCFCFSSDTAVIRSTTERLCYQSQQTMKIELEIDNSGSSKPITKISYEFKRMLIFKSGYTCSKEFKTGETQIKLVKSKGNEVFECKLPIALALSHHSNLVHLKYLVEFKIYSANTLLDIHQHDFYIEPNEAQEKWEDKADGNQEIEEKEDAHINILKQNSTINWERCRSTVDYYYTNIDHLRKTPSINSNIINSPH